ncbi:MAG: carboxypeptidase regulatory-like domain-containing protein [Chloracidobacterium sp.]|nr:carboxypeptidase regulatory-like domain-containing protein [Chloracidobacterium sp.]
MLFAFSFLSLDVTSSQSQPGQSGQSGKINGKVTDPQDYPIPDARVIVRNETTGETRDVNTDKEGRFKIEALAPGRYAFSVTCPGFKLAKRNVTIEGGRTETVEIKLDIWEHPGPVVVIQSHAPEQSLKITILAAQNRVKAGDPIEIAITMKNLSDHDITMRKWAGNTQAELDFGIIVKGNNGATLNETRYKKGVNRGIGSIAGSSRLLTLNPGEEITEKSKINKLYDMSIPGGYTVQVEKELPASEGKGMVKSNTITVIVTP